VVAAAKERDVPLEYEPAREYVYDMPYAQWKAQHQVEASAEQQQAYANRQSDH